MRINSRIFAFSAALAAVSLVQVAVAQDKIAFTSSRDGNNEVYSMAGDGTGQTNLTNNAASDSHPSISLNGTKIAFDSNRDGNSEIYLMNPDGTGQINLTNNAAADYDPSAGPNASVVVFTSERDGNSEIYIMNADGTGQVNVSNNGASDTEPTISQDGLQIVFTSDRVGRPQVFIMNVDGTGVAQVTFSVGSSMSPTLNPAATLCVYSANRGGVWELFSVPVGGGVTTPLTTAGGLEPAFNVDGTQIAFSTNRTGNKEVFVMNPDGTSQTNVSTNGSSDGTPAYGVAADSSVVPFAARLVRGVLLSGGVAELAASDDQKMVARAGVVLFPGESPLQFEMTGTAPIDTPSELKFKLEASVSTPGLMQTLFMFNYDTAAYEQVDFWAGTPSDSIIEVVITTDPERFIEAGTREMKSKVVYTQVGAVLFWPWNASLDHTVWTVIN